MNREAWDYAGERMLELVPHLLRRPTYHTRPGTWEWKVAECLTKLGLLRKDGWGAAGRLKYTRTDAGTVAIGDGAYE